jgi:hypothetical protein
MTHSPWRAFGAPDLDLLHRLVAFTARAREAIVGSGAQRTSRPPATHVRVSTKFIAFPRIPCADPHASQARTGDVRSYRAGSR